MNNERCENGDAKENFQIPQVNQFNFPRRRGRRSRLAYGSNTYLRERGKNKVDEDKNKAAGGIMAFSCTVGAGEDVGEKINEIFGKLVDRQSAWVVSAKGYISHFKIQQPNNTGTLTIEGLYQIATLNASSILDEKGTRLNCIRIHATGNEIHVGGLVFGRLTAATPVILTIGVFEQKLRKKIRKKKAAYARRRAAPKEDELAMVVWKPRPDYQVSGPSTQAQPTSPPAQPSQANPSFQVVFENE